MGEALINHLGQGRFHAVSAGSHPAGYVHPKSIATLNRHGIEIADPRSKSWDEFAEQRFDLVITVCDQAAGESCPIAPGTYRKLHWSTPDPASVEGDEAEIDRAFEDAFERLQTRVREELLQA